MATPLKDLYSPAFYQQFGNVMSQVLESFDYQKFRKRIFDQDWETKELKDRMNHTALVLHDFLPQPYPEATQKIIAIIDRLEAAGITENSLEFMFFPAYIEHFGRADFETSVNAMERITQFTSCEFAVRPFYLNYPKQMLAQTMKWAKHSDHRVRRLASEGCRPRLPWAMAIPYLKKDPSPILPILKLLKDDPAEWVRRSVANNLNDVSKDHPEIIISLAKEWIGRNPHLDWVIKHGSRTLLKQGNAEIMRLFGFGSVEDIGLQDFNILTPQLSIGSDLRFEFQLENKSELDQQLRLEYGIYYLRANGSLSRKVFKISEKTYAGLSIQKIERKQSFRIITTRRFYPGEHWVSLIINGQEMDKKAFTLVNT